MANITGELFEQMLEDLENGTFVPTANEGAPKPLYYPYSGWEEMLECDQLAYDEISDQYLKILHNRKR